MSTLQLDNVEYIYHTTGAKVLRGVTQAFATGKVYSVVGPSGAGKSTLLNLLAGLDNPSKGRVAFDGKDIRETGLNTHRRAHVSLVFQAYNLIDYLTPLENLRLVDPKAEVSVLEKLGLTKEQATRSVTQLSGGQQQRVAIGRALVSPAPVILADEPTGNLDEETAQEVMGMLQDAAHTQGKCVIMVTHSRSLASTADHKLVLKNRKLVQV